MIDKKSKISVVIATKNRFQDIIKCVESILIQTLLPNEIVIVDASDTQELNLKIKEFKSEKTKIICIHTKAGMTYQWNIGVKNSCGDIIFILDDDVILEMEFMEEIVKIFEDDKGKKVGGVYGNIVDTNNSKKTRYRILTSIFNKLVYHTLNNLFFLSKVGNGKFRLSGFPTFLYGTNKISIVECLPGGLTAYRKEVFKEFMFDENIRFMADDEFSYRVSRKYQNVYTPYAKVVHTVSPVARENISLRKKMLIESYCYHFKKNLPQTFRHKFAFYMAVCGLFLEEILTTIVSRNTNSLKGLIDGISGYKRRN